MTPETSESGRVRDSAGIATVWAVAWMLVFVLVGAIAMVLGFAASRQHQVDAAADLVALSAAAKLQRGADACSTAARVANANRVVLRECRIAHEDVIVDVRARVALPFGWQPWISARARAGPD